MRKLLVGVIAVADAVNGAIGLLAAVMTVGIVVACFAVVAIRYGFSQVGLGVNFAWLQDLYVWLHGAAFMLGAGYTLKHGGHVRVDLFYARWSARTRAWVDIIGFVVFLLPWLVVIMVYCSPTIISSWQILEYSQTANGLPGLFLLKSCIWGFAVLLFLQGLAMTARRILYLQGDESQAADLGAGHLPLEHDPAAPAR